MATSNLFEFHGFNLVHGVFEKCTVQENAANALSMHTTIQDEATYVVDKTRT